MQAEWYALVELERVLLLDVCPGGLCSGFSVSQHLSSFTSGIGNCTHTHIVFILFYFKILINVKMINMINKYGSDCTFGQRLVYLEVVVVGHKFFIRVSRQ